MVVPYQCQRLYQGRPVTVVLSDLDVPKCGHCGELVFDQVAEQQINTAFQAQTSALNISDKAKDKNVTPIPETGHSSLVQE